MIRLPVALVLILLMTSFLVAQEAPVAPADKVTAQPAASESEKPKEDAPKATEATTVPPAEKEEPAAAPSTTNKAEAPAPAQEAAKPETGAATEKAPPPAVIENPGSLFIESDPLGAHIRIGAQSLTATTPTLIRGLTPGEYTVTLFKVGSKAWEGKIVVEGGKVVVLKSSLQPNSFAMIFPENAKISFGNEAPIDAEKRQFKLPSGTYSIDNQNGTLKVQRFFPEDVLVTITGWGVPLTAGLATVSTMSDVMGKRTDGPPISVSTAVLYFLLISDTAWHISLQDKKARFFKENAETSWPQPEDLDLASTVFAKAEALMEDGKIDQAAQEYQRLTRDYPESPQVASAWFKLARIHALKGDRALAKGEYNLVAETYQQSDNFDRAHKALADMESADGNYISALYHLKQLVFLDPMITQQDVASQISDLEAKIAQASQTPPAAPEAPHAQ